MISSTLQLKGKNVLARRILLREICSEESLGVSEQRAAKALSMARPS